MPKSAEDKVRLNVELERELYLELRQRLPWGTKSEVVRGLLTILLKKIEEEGNPVEVVKTLVTGKYSLVAHE